MKKQRMLIVLIALNLLTACGRVTTITPLGVATSGSGSSAATSSSSAIIYAFDKDQGTHIFSVTMATGELVLTTPATQPANLNTVQQITVGPWIYKVNTATNAIDLYAVSNQNVIVESFFISNGISSIALSE